jgi:hypothetical protein
LAVRSVIERAVLEMMSRLYHAPQIACTSNLGTGNDPLADAADRRPMPQPAQFKHTTTAMNEENNNDTSRQNPYRGYSDGDAPADTGLRGQLQ